MQSPAMTAVMLALVANSGSVPSPLAQNLLAQHLVQNTPPAAQNLPAAPAPPSPPPATEGRGPVPQAPVGHRQPTQRDLPPDVLRREQPEGQPQVRDSYQPPSICRGC
jgi:hypothetical protein